MSFYSRAKQHEAALSSRGEATNLLPPNKRRRVEEYEPTDERYDEEKRSENDEEGSEYQEGISEDDKEGSEYLEEDSEYEENGPEDQGSKSRSKLAHSQTGRGKLYRIIDKGDHFLVRLLDRTMTKTQRMAEAVKTDKRLDTRRILTSEELADMGYPNMEDMPFYIEAKDGRQLVELPFARYFSPEIMIGMGLGQKLAEAREIMARTRFQEMLAKANPELKGETKYTTTFRVRNYIRENIDSLDREDVDTPRASCDKFMWTDEDGHLHSPRLSIAETAIKYNGVHTKEWAALNRRILKQNCGNTVPLAPGQKEKPSAIYTRNWQKEKRAGTPQGQCEGTTKKGSRCTIKTFEKEGRFLCGSHRPKARE